VFAPATGFRVDRFLRPIDLVGRDGVRLDEVLGAAAVRLLVGVGSGFSEPFHAQRPQWAGRNFSLIDVAEAQFAYLMQLADFPRCGRRVSPGSRTS
jgi:hypothetical protein